MPRSPILALRQKKVDLTNSAKNLLSVAERESRDLTPGEEQNHSKILKALEANEAEIVREEARLAAENRGELMPDDNMAFGALARGAVQSLHRSRLSFAPFDPLSSTVPTVRTVRAILSSESRIRDITACAGAQLDGNSQGSWDCEVNRSGLREAIKVLKKTSNADLAGCRFHGNQHRFRFIPFDLSAREQLK